MKTKKIMYKVLWQYHTGDSNDFNLNSQSKYMLSIAPFLTKSKDWEYEEEVRCILSFGNERIVVKDEMRFYKMRKIKSIIMGCNF